MPAHPTRELKLQQEIVDRSNQLVRMHKLDRYDMRPMSARGAGAVAGLSPRQPNSPRSLRSSSDRPRPLTGVAAYRNLGLAGKGANWLLPSAADLVDKYRKAPKYEEQLMLGFLSSQPRMTPRAQWKIKRFEQEGPRAF